MRTSDKNAQHEAGTMDDFLVLLEDVSRQIGTMKDRGTLYDQDLNVAMASLDRLQLILKDMERSEVRRNGVSRGAADRFAELEGRIRSLQDMVRHDQKRWSDAH